MKIKKKTKILDRNVFWDMSIPETNTYVLSNGNVVHNCGFGFSVERQYINELPEVAEAHYPSDTTLTIRDSKIGWATGLKELISMLYNGQIPKWDLSRVRPAGSRLKTFGGRACLTGDTILYKDRKKPRGQNEITIKELFDLEHSQGFWENKPNHFKQVKIRSLDEKNGIFYRNNVIAVIDNGVAPVYEILTENGYRIKATGNHRFMSSIGEYEYLDNFNVGDLIAVNGSRKKKTGTCINCGCPVSRRAIRCVDCNNKNQLSDNAIDTTARQRKECRSYSKDYCEYCNVTDTRLEIHHIDENTHNNDHGNLVTLCCSCHQKEHARRRTFSDPYTHKYMSYDKIISISYKGEERVYDLQMEAPDHNFVANGFVSHNSGPDPLDRLFNHAVSIFTNAQGRKLTSIECHDLMCHIADTVIVGSVRRAALISLSNLSDDRMRRAKDGQWWQVSPHRALANNSVAYTEKPDLDSFSKEWRTLYKSKSGERGIWNKEGAKLIAEARGREHDGDYIPNPSLRHDTKVWTTEGIREISCLDGDFFNVRNRNGKIVEAICFKSAEDLQLWNIELKGNHLYQCSPEHKWAVFSDRHKTKIIKKRADEIIAGDVIIKNGFHDNISNVSTQKRDKDIGYLIGWNIGHGWKTVRNDDGSTQYGFIVSDEDKLNGCDDIISKTLKEVCGCKDTLLDKNEINVNNKNLNLLFDEVGYDNKSEGLPSVIWGFCSEDKIRGLIDGLFSADGCVSSDSITLKTAYREIANDVSDLLGFYGINTSIHKEEIENQKSPNDKDHDRTYVYYSVQISGYLDIVHFHSLFNLTHKSKNEKICELIKKDKDTYQYNDGILVKKSYLSDEYDDVYDISVNDNTATFQLAHCITGNCGEVSIRDTGGVCNLTEVILRPDDSFEQVIEKLRLATIMGTIQASLTNFRFLRKVWKTNAEEERLLGVSITGIMDHPVFSFTKKHIHDWTGDSSIQDLPSLLRYMRDYAHDVNKRWAAKLGINATGHVCVIKPSGTVSILTGTSSGIHPRYSRYYTRRVRNNKKDPLSKLMVDQGIPYDNEGDNYVFSFFVKSPEHAVIQKDIGAMKQLDIWKIYKENWCDGNPSQTIYYTDDDYFSIADWLWKNWDTVGGLSFFPHSDAIYNNAPLEAISKTEYNTAMKSFPTNIDWEKLKEYETLDTTKSAQTLACAGNGCSLE